MGHQQHLISFKTFTILFCWSYLGCVDDHAGLGKTVSSAHDVTVAIVTICLSIRVFLYHFPIRYLLNPHYLAITYADRVRQLGCYFPMFRTII